ncbi:MAG: ABC transporter ATP-binding protein [Armatimonadota bacterium]
MKIGALVEVPAFYEYFTAWRNLQMLASLSGPVDIGEMEWALRAVRLWGRHHDRVSDYSHGMKQRLGIAQALVPRPDVLILDEPAQGLDPGGLAEVRDLLRDLAADGMTIFLSSHLLSEVEQICSHVGLIVSGKLIAEGPVEALLGGEHRYTLCVTSGDSLPALLRDDPIVTEFEAVAADTFVVKLAEDRPEALNARLVEAGVGVRSLAPRKTNLEAFYLQLAGTPEDGGGQSG